MFIFANRSVNLWEGIKLNWEVKSYASPDPLPTRQKTLIGCISGRKQSVTSYYIQICHLEDVQY